MNRLSLILIILLFTGLVSCKSQKSTVVRATGKPTTSATVKDVPSVPKNAASKGEYANDKKISNELVKQARTWIGTPYRYGGSTKKKGTDCSGMTMMLFKDVANLSLPRNSAEQCQYCFNVPRSALQPGDLVFFTSSTRGGKVSHVGLYIGNGKMIHASASRGVIESALDEKYYASHYHSSGRVYGITCAATGGKKQKSGDVQDLLLASEGVKPSSSGGKSNQTQKSQKAKDSKKSKSAGSSKKNNKSTSGAVIAAATTQTAVPATVEMTLDEFVANQQPKADTTLVVEQVINETVAAIDSAAAMVDSVRAVIADTIATPSGNNGPVPTMIVNGKRVQATAVEPKQGEMPKSAPTDTIRAEAIKEEVVKAMKFGK